MSNEEMAKEIESELLTMEAIWDGVISGKMRPMVPSKKLWIALRAGATALRDVDELKAKWKREECGHCDERRGGYNGTIYCEECFNWYVLEDRKEMVADLQRDVERLRVAMKQIYDIATFELAEPPDTGALVRICTIIEELNQPKEAADDAR